LNLNLCTHQDATKSEISSAFISSFKQWQEANDGKAEVEKDDFVTVIESALKTEITDKITQEIVEWIKEQQRNSED